MANPPLKEIPYTLFLGTVKEFLAGQYGVGFKVRDERRGYAWYVAVPGLQHVAGPFGRRDTVLQILNTLPKQHRTANDRH